MYRYKILSILWKKVRWINLKEKDLKIEVTEIYNLLDNIGWDLSEAREKLDNLEEEIKHKEKQSIKDINNFKIELKKARLYTEEMEDFIQGYMRYYNK